MTTDYDQQELEKLLLHLGLEAELPPSVEPAEDPRREPLPFPQMPGYGAQISLRECSKQMEAFAMHMHGLSVTTKQSPPAAPPAVAKNHAQYLPGQASLDALFMDIS